MVRSKNKTAVIVSSFDGYSDCWEPFLHGFTKYWSNCEYEIFLITNHLNSPDESVLKSIKVGENNGWASRMIHVLEAIDADYIIYLNEDYWIDEYINQKYIASIVGKMFKNNWDYFRLAPIPGPDKLIEGEEYGLTTSASKYQLCLQASIWKKSLLRSLLFHGETCWDFENKTADRMKDIPIKSFSVSKNDPKGHLVSYSGSTAVRKGNWTRSAANYIEKENLNFDFTKRKMESNFTTYLSKISGKSFFLNILAYFLIRSYQFLTGKRSFKSIFKS